ncbi:MAG: PHP domain-containing protein [Candidatus Omnitrophica bacterium]|nr:PHP domain-containing protein [Candidatus Omnitrophota bacterium]
MEFADLHLHTVFSDSTYAPQELAFLSKEAGLSCISIVDHDTVDSIEPALGVSKEIGIEVLPGIELTAQYADAEVHILGYLIDYHDQYLKKRLESLKADRRIRIYKMIEKLKDMGINLDAESVFSLAKHAAVGRMHLAMAMKKYGFVDSIGEAFKKYIGEKSPAYILGFNLSPKEAIDLIIQAKGIPVLAHPYSINPQELIFKFIDLGLKGLEVYYPEHTHSMIENYLGIAQKYNLLVTGGSDCHGLNKPEIKLGAIKIPYDLVQRLKEFKD